MDVEQRLRANTVIFLAASGTNQVALAAHLGIKARSLNLALSRDDPHVVKHLEGIAEFFGVDPRILLADPDRVWHDYPVTGQYLTPETAGAVA